MSKHLLSAFLIALCFVCPACAQENDASDAASTKAEPKLEDAKNAEDVTNYMQTLRQTVQAEVQKIAEKGEVTMEAIGPFMQKMAEQTVAASEKLLALATDEKQREEAYTMLLQGLKQLSQREKFQEIEKLKKEQNLTAEDERDMKKMMPLYQKVEELETAAQKRITALLEEWEKSGKYAELVAREKFGQFIQSAGKIYADFTPEKFEQFKNEAKKWVNKKIEGVDTSRILNTVLELAGMEKAVAVDPKLAEKTREELLAFLKSDECTLPQNEKEAMLLSFEGAAKRAVGAELNLYGKTLDDKDFDWQSLRGKTVLVKFTASWCGPCKGEIPGMKTAYEKYKDKGFEIVSVYVWDSLANSKKAVEEEKLPWICLSEELSEKAGLPPQGKAYAIQGVPTMLLIDKDGKVTEAAARGPALEEKLAEIFEN